MTIKLYDLVSADGRRFSGNCWRTHLALAHKGLPFETVPTRFTDIPNIGDGSHKTIPMIEDGGKEVCDSWVIANYLEETYPDMPSLFGEGGVTVRLAVHLCAEVATWHRRKDEHRLLLFGSTGHGFVQSWLPGNVVRLCGLGNSQQRSNDEETRKLYRKRHHALPNNHRSVS